MHVKVSSYDPIESHKKGEGFIRASQKEKLVKFAPDFIRNLCIKVARSISKIKIRKLFPSKTLTRNEWHIE